ncbi:protein CTLA-2-alpha [Zeugodacus cucurbitae]|uniref:Protein CTLA-2-alpha n=1 Tax=Zeugodacus cucurbitae TaxID=28588 RepID=A0A0A1WJC7_ZEUCU|nr:protein CTLA-2-alpha [Zeugodacus cucurbitae]
MSTFFNSLHRQSVLLILLLMIVAACSKFCVEDDCSSQRWHLYKVEYKKQYNSQLEEAHRRIIFCKNLRMIDAHNERYKRGEVTFEMGINQFADMSHEEFLRWLHTGSRDNGSILSSL